MLLGIHRHVGNAAYMMQHALPSNPRWLVLRGLIIPHGNFVAAGFVCDVHDVVVCVFPAQPSIGTGICRRFNAVFDGSLQVSLVNRPLLAAFSPVDT